jgi:thiol-disulfide isomerase/thioredoxin
MTNTQRTRMQAPRSRELRGNKRATCVLLSLLGMLLGATSALAVVEGEPAPVFDAPALGGSGSVSLDDHRGKVVYLDFWASWCPPCLESLPQIDRLSKAFPEDAFQVLAVNVDSKPKKALKFLKRNPVGYPSASDPKGVLPKRYGLKTMPTSYLIDQRGIVRYVHNGFRREDIDELRSRIQQMLEEEQ